MILPWLVRHSAMTLNIGQRGEDGRSAWERVKGKCFNREVPEFGEKVLYLKPESLGVNKLDSRWEPGHFLGIRDESGELYIGTKDGVLKVRTFRSYVTLSDRWGAASLIDIDGLPWEPVPGREGIEVKASVSFAKEVDGSRLQHETTEQKLKQPRAVYINKADVKRYAMTPGCDG